MPITIQKNRKFFREVAQFNPYLAQKLEFDHGWIDKLVQRSDDAGISQPRRRQEGTAKAGNNQQDQTVALSNMDGN